MMAGDGPGARAALAARVGHFARCRRAAILAVAVLGVGCAARRPSLSPMAPAVLPSVATLDAALAERRESLHSLRALAHVRYRDADGSTSSRQAVLAARPDRLRIEVLSVFGSPFVLAVSDGTLTAYARQENTIYRGHASAQNLQRYVRLGLPVEELIDILLGTPPPRTARRAQVAFDADAGAVRLTEEFARGVQVVWFSAETLPVAAEERWPDGRTSWRATFGQYQDRGATRVATQLRLEMPVQRSLDIGLEDVDVNAALDDKLFAVQTPPGSRVVELDPVVN